MGKFIDLTGKVFERLTVVEMVGRQSGHVTWECECECGTLKTVRGVDLRNGNTTSCGCYRKETLHENRKKITKRGRKKKEVQEQK